MARTINPPQGSFLGGVLDPYMYGRIDMDQYSVGIKSGGNIFFQPQGPAVARPAFRHVYPCYSDDKKSRLIRFVFSTIQAYILEFADQKIRVFKEKGYVDGGGGTPVEISSPWTEAQLADIFICQKADVLYIAHPDVQPRTLTRSSHTSWTLATYSPTAQPGHWAASSWPRTVQFFEQRLWWGGTKTAPQTMNGTKIGDYTSFAVSSPLEDTDGVEYTLDSNDVQNIQWLRSFSELMVGTVSGEWKLDSGDSSTITPTEPPIARQQTSYGSARVQPIQVGSELLYIEYHGQAVRAMSYDLASDSYEGKDLGVLSSQYLRGAGNYLVDWAYTRVPAGIVWMLRSDGKLLSMTYMKQHKVVSWAEHESAGGVFESLATVRDETGKYDALYVTVKRTVKWNCWDVVDATSGEAYDTFTLPEDRTFDDEAGVWVDGKFYRYKGAGSIVATGGDVVVTFSDSPSYCNDEIESIFVGSALDDTNWEELDDASRVRRYIEVMDAPWYSDESFVDCFFVDSGLTYDGAATTAITGLDHLEGVQVQILADGSPMDPQVVTGGKVTLNSARSVVHAGLGYNKDLEIMPVEILIEGGSSMGKKKAIKGATIKVYQSAGIYAGINGSDGLRYIPLFNALANPNQGLAPYSGDVDIEGIVSGYQTQHTVFVRQSDPLPMTVLAIVPEWEVTEGGI